MQRTNANLSIDTSVSNYWCLFEVRNDYALLEIKLTAPKSAHLQKVILAGKCTCFACDVIISMAMSQMERSDWLRAQIVVTCRCILHNEV